MWRLLKLTIALGAVVAATLGSELSLSQRAQRAQRERLLADAAQQLEHVPQVIGDWHMQSETEFSQQVVDTLECRGHVSRTYLNQRTGKSVSFVLIVGPPGPLLAHRPEVCMDGQGYRMVAGPEHVTLGSNDGSSHELFRTTFAVGTKGQRILVYYGWARGDRCEAPEWPRLALGREPMLYKLQVSSSVENLELASGANKQADPGQQFVDDFLPVLSRLRSEETSRTSDKPLTDSGRTAPERALVGPVHTTLGSVAERRP